jgi:chromosome partitioning protein
MIISLVNQKGGAAKTSTALNLGAALARAGQNVLLVDLDPQGSLSTFTALNEPRATLRNATPATLARVLSGEPFDYALLDCPPYLGQEAAAALKVSDLAIAPTPPRFLDVAGFALLRETVQEAAERGKSNLDLRLLVTFREARAAVHRDYEENLRGGFGDLVFQTAVPRSIVFDRAADAHTSIFRIDGRSPAAQAFRELAKEVMALGNKK